jgi:hypothetical protein
VFCNSKTLQAQKERSISESRIKIADGGKWLKAQFGLNTTNRNKFITNLLENLDTGNISKEILNRNEFLIIIPLKRIHYSQQKTEMENPISILLLVEDSSNKIRRGDVMHFFPKSPDIKKLPKDLLHDFFEGHNLSVDGTFMLTNLSDVKQYEAVFVDGRNIEMRLWRAKRIDECNYWEWHLTITKSSDFYKSGDFNDIKTTSELLGTTEKECPPGYICD